MELAAQELMDALAGVAYAIDPEGRIVACGRPGWDAFVADNGGSGCAAGDAVVGQDLFASIEGEEVAAGYRSWLADLAGSDRGALTFQYRCDSPSLKREMRMSITRIGNARQLRGYHRPGCAGDDDGMWVEAEEYYRTGGSSEVRISHGLCPGCVHRFETS